VKSLNGDIVVHAEWREVHEQWHCSAWRVTRSPWIVTLLSLQSDCTVHGEWLYCPWRVTEAHEVWLCGTWRLTLHSSWATLHRTIYQSTTPLWQLQVSQLLVSLKCWQGQIDTEDGDCALGKLVGAKEDIILEFIAIWSTLSCVVHLSYYKRLISPNFYRSIPAHLFFYPFRGLVLSILLTDSCYTTCKENACRTRNRAFFQ
jgi:hypothetical protein